MGSVGAGTCNFWSAPFFSSMLPCPRIPEHLMQVPDLIDLALTVFFGGRWHILQTGVHMNIQENNSHCLIQAKFDMKCEATSLARTLSAGLRRKFPFFGLLFARPENIFWGPRFCVLWLFLRCRMNLVTFFGPPKIFFRLEFGPLKRDWQRQFWAIQARRR